MWVIYIIFSIVIAILSAIVSDELTGSALEGLWIATLPFCHRYWKIWMETEEKDCLANGQDE